MPVAHVHTVDQDTARRSIVSAVDQLSECAFTHSCLPDQCDDLPRLDLERDVLQGRCTAWIRKRYILERDFTLDLGVMARSILVQVSLREDEWQNSAGRCQAKRQVRKAEQRQKK